MRTMRGRVALAVLATMGGSAGAAWEPVGSNDAVYLYADKASLQNSGERAQMSDLVEFRTRQELGGREYQSQKEEIEYDCKAKQFRILATTLYPYRLGEGAALLSLPGPGQWQALLPGTGTELLWKIACVEASPAKKPKRK